MKNKTLTILSYILVACVASIVTIAFSHNKQEPISENTKLAELQGIITECYIGGADSQALTDAAAAGMVQGTGDQWSYYVPAAQMQEYKDNQNNSYVGVGITVRQREDGTGLDVIAVTQGGPAQEAGLLPGDILWEVSGESVAELGMDGATALIKGEQGTTVELTVLRGEEKLTFTVERRAIEVIVASGQMLSGNIGMLTIENFNRNSAKRSIEVIEQLRQQGATALILDVRNNPGGFRHELVALLDYLLPEGELFRSEHYDGTVKVNKSDAACLDMPMVVLVNGDSYSAAEFFAAALWEYEAATVVGTQTYGKGYYQQQIDLSDGSAVNLSTGRYFTPKGNSLAGVGLTPDRVVEVDDETYIKIYYDQLPVEEDPQIQEAINILNGK